MEWTNELKEAARTAGADLVGITDLEPFRADGLRLGPDYDRFTKALSVAIHLDDGIVDTIDGAPTAVYARHYREVNARLDRLTGTLVDWITARGFSARAVPASETLDKENLLGLISHKAVARMAGIGWQGKSLLIVSREYGPRIRLATLLTDMPLTRDNPAKNRCGSCRACVVACPAAAIRNVGTKDRYADREEALFFSRCVAQTLLFKARPDIGVTICGVCVQVCPFGRKKRDIKAGSQRRV
jgi:epoxyqueuosine reductase QueG